MTKKLDQENKSQPHVIRTHIVPCYLDWDLKSIWKMLKPTIYEDEEGNFQTGSFVRMPDGEPTHWDIILMRGDRSYHRVGDEECNCDLSSGEMCPHWCEIRL